MAIPDKVPWWQRVMWPAAFVAAFLLSLYWTFPTEPLARRIEAEARAQGYDVSIGQLSLWRGTGVALKQVAVMPPPSQAGAEPLHVVLEEVDARLNVLPLLFGHRSIYFRALAWSGKLTGTYSEAKSARDVSFELADLDLAGAVPLRQLTGLDFGGKVSGSGKLSLDAQKGLPAASGKVSAKIAGGGVTGGSVYGFPVKAGLGNIEAALTIASGDAKLDRLTAKSGDIEAEGDGVVHLRPLAALSPLDAKFRVKPGQPWLDLNPLVKGAMTLPAVANAKDPDGWLSYKIAGTLGAPLPRPGR